MDSSSDYSNNDDYDSDNSTDSDKKTLYSDDELIKLMKIDHTYPEPTDPNFQEKIFKKREFYYPAGRRRGSSYYWSLTGVQYAQ